MTQRLDFIDVSHYQGEINFAKVKAAGVLGIIAKATEGTSSFDSKYIANRNGALAAGLVFASYHFLKHDSVSQQMSWYMSKASPVKGERVVIDYEDTSVTSDDLISAVQWLQSNRPDLEITVYGASKLTDDVNKKSDPCLKQTSLWAARYSSNEPVIATGIWPHWSAWQYSESGKVDGISGNVDLDTFNGSRENCIDWFGPTTEPVPTPVAQILAAYTIQPGQRLVVTVNGAVVYESPGE